MNYTTAIFLVNPSVRCIAVSYDVSTDAKGQRKASEIVSFKSLDSDLKVGDFVVVPTETRHKMTIGCIEQVDLDPDFDSHQQMRWIIDRVDVKTVDAIKEQEETAIVRIRAAETRSKKEELAAKLLKDNPDLAGLSIVDLRGAADAPAKSTYEPEPDKRGGSQPVA